MSENSVIMSICGVDLSIHHLLMLKASVDMSKCGVDLSKQCLIMSKSNVIILTEFGQVNTIADILRQLWRSIQLGKYRVAPAIMTTYLKQLRYNHFYFLAARLLTFLPILKQLGYSHV